MLVTIQDIYRQTKKLSGLEEVKIRGWAKSSIRQKKFVDLNDGSCLPNLQVVFSPSLAEKIKKINFGSGLIIKGKLILTPERAQTCELQAQEIEFISLTESDYPLQKQIIPLRVVRDYPHLRAKTNYFLALFRLRHSISKTIHDFFNQEEFYYVSTPIITSNDTEGISKMFNITTKKKSSFFSKIGKLTVSGQLQAEALAQGLGRVYTFSPCFRAEDSHTTHHLAEFWMVEAEMIFTNLEDIIALAERLVKHVVDYVLTNNFLELKFLQKRNQKDLIAKLKELINKKFVKIEYSECIKILAKQKKNFVFNDVKWGMNFQSEHENYLCQHFNDEPIFIINYPAELKAFYMKTDPKKKTVANFDLLLPELGEVIGGSVREDNYQVLKEKAQEKSLEVNNLSWYFDLRRYGYIPSAGFGLGLERLIMLISKTKNIRDTIAFPRFPKSLNF